jgi:membrane protein YdbS with pleckstrin-like domain
MWQYFKNSLTTLILLIVSIGTLVYLYSTTWAPPIIFWALVVGVILYGIVKLTIRKRS